MRRLRAGVHPCGRLGADRFPCFPQMCVLISVATSERPSATARAAGAPERRRQPSEGNSTEDAPMQVGAKSKLSQLVHLDLEARLGILHRLAPQRLVLLVRAMTLGVGRDQHATV